MSRRSARLSSSANTDGASGLNRGLTSSKAANGGRKNNQKAARSSTQTQTKAKGDTLPNSSRKRTRSEPEKEESGGKEEKQAPPSKRSRSSKTKKNAKPEPDLEAGAKLANSMSNSDPANGKANPYNLSPGASPYPWYSHPTPEECQEVHDCLASVHGTVSPPEKIPTPSLQSSGCGEVPSVLDALVRTRLSANTNGSNSSRAFRGLVEKFGVIKEGVGKGSVNWDDVRRRDRSDLFDAIKSGGLADVKSKDIKAILQLVYEENQTRGKELKDEDDAVAKANNNVLSLDHLHAMSSDEAFQKLLSYPGIGPKTASCVLLFCMQRPSFAVDTHVFRLTRWLGWTPSDAEVKRKAKEMKKSFDSDQTNGDDENVKKEEYEPDQKGASPKKSKFKPPPPVERNSTYSHLDVRVPDELKYSLHYLLIKHGKNCPSCMAKSDGKAKQAWGNKACPIKHLKSGSKKKAANTTDEAVVKEEEDDEADGISEADIEEEEEQMHGM